MLLSMNALGIATFTGAKTQVPTLISSDQYLALFDEVVARVDALNAAYEGSVLFSPSEAYREQLDGAHPNIIALRAPTPADITSLNAVLALVEKAEHSRTMKIVGEAAGVAVLVGLGVFFYTRRKKR
jgi:hypothetical protein